MPELENVEAQKTAGYMSRTRTKYKDKIEKEEKELKELMAQADSKKVEEESEEEKENSATEASLSDEEKSFKTRYGDLRRHLAAKDKAHAEKIEELEARLNTPTKLVAPKSS